MRTPSTFRRIIIVVGILWIMDCNLAVRDAAAAPPVKEDRLSGVTQNWDKVLPAAQRFTVLPAFNNEGVRDNETGLVWERSPANSLLSWLGQNGALEYETYARRYNEERGLNITSEPRPQM